MMEKNSRNWIMILSAIIAIVIFTSCDKEISTTPPDEDPPKGFIFVDSKPNDYKIYLDGRFTGRFTPDTLPYVEETEHFLELKKKYWLDSSLKVIAEHNITKSLYVDFFEDERVYGDLKLFSTPENATVEINDSITSITTPYVIRGLRPGIYTIGYHLDQHRSVSTKIAVESNKEKSISLALQDTSIWVDFTDKNSDLPNNNVVTLDVDQDNRIWAGTVNHGIVTIKGSDWHLINTSNSGLPTDSIRVIKVDNNNTIWIGTYKGLIEYRNNTVQRVIDETNSPMYVARINAIDFLNDNTIIVGSNSGMLKIEPSGNMQLYPAEDESVERIVSTLATSKNSNKVWVGIKGNIGEYSRQFDRIIYNYKDDPFFEIVNQYFLSKLMVRPADNKLWALFSSTGNLGLRPFVAVWNGDAWSYEMLERGNLIFYDMTTDSENIVWVASNMGLGKFENIRDRVFLREDNSLLFSNKLLSVVEDKNGVLWIGSNNGLFKYKKNLIR